MSFALYPNVSAFTPNAVSFTVANGYTDYAPVYGFIAGTYTIASNGATQYTTFYRSDGTIIGTANGNVTYNLAEPAAGVYLKTTGGVGSNAIVTYTYVAKALDGVIISGTVDIITTTSVYNQTGKLYVVAFGGGGGGAGGGHGYWTNGGWNCGVSSGGGGSGYMASTGSNYSGFYTYSTTSHAIVIGSGGNGGTPAGANSGRAGGGAGNAGGTTTFGNIVSAAGGEGGPGGRASAGGGGAGGYGSDNCSQSSPFYDGQPTDSVIYKQVLGSATTGGGGGAAEHSGGSGGGSGVGTGGNAGNGVAFGQNTVSANNGNSATGYAAGGGAGGMGRDNRGAGGNAGNGTPGIVYVLRGF